jgi:hypothetical protein
MAGTILTATGFAIAAIWTQLGTAVRRRHVESAIVIALACVLVGASTHAHSSWDLSEARLSSFSESDERWLTSLEEPLRIEAHLAPEDPRRSDLERTAVSKLRRVVPDFGITYIATTSTGLFEQTRDQYGEIHYRLGDREVVSRATTADAVLDEIHVLAGFPSAVDGDEDDAFPGHPLAAAPTGAPAVFYVMWPAAVAGAAMMSRRRGS